MERISLNGEWSLSFVHPETEKAHRIPAAVPGNVELDLERAGLLADALPATGEHAGRWVDLADWTYLREFEFAGLPAGTEKAVLTFDGIDTVAEVFLNGELLFHAENMFIAHSADVTAKLRSGTNTLTVRIAAPEIAARKFTPPPFPSTPREPSLYLRKARHMWGWDNAPHRLSAGIWRSVNLEFLPPVRFESVYACTEFVRPEDDSAELMCRYAFTTPDRDLSAYRLRVRLVRNGECAFDRRFPVLHTSGRLSSGKLTVKHPALWFPPDTANPISTTSSSNWRRMESPWRATATNSESATSGSNAPKRPRRKATANSAFSATAKKSTCAAPTGSRSPPTTRRRRSGCAGPSNSPSNATAT